MFVLVVRNYDDNNNVNNEGEGIFPKTEIF